MEIYENLSLSYSHAIECSISWQGLLQNKKLKLNLASVCEEHWRKKNISRMTRVWTINDQTNEWISEWSSNCCDGGYEI